MPDPAITELISEDKLLEAIEALQKGIQMSGQTSLSNDLILMKSRYNKNEKDNRLGLVTTESYRMTLNRIRAGLIELNDLLETGEEEAQNVSVRETPDSGSLDFGMDFRDVYSTPDERAGSEFDAGRESKSGQENGADPGDGDSAAEAGIGEGAPLGTGDAIKKILYLAASPKGETRIEGDKEFSRITAAMERGRKRDNFIFLHPQFAVTAPELVRSMRDDPNIIHFSVHGEPEALIISDHDNNAQPLPQMALVRLLRPLQGITEVVILNSCFSSQMAREISELGMYVTGNNFEILDTASISFVSGLYSGLGEGKTFEEAYNDAMVMVGIMNPEEIHILEVWKDGEKLDI